MRSLGIDIGGTAVKTAIVSDGETVATGISISYSQPTLQDLQAAIASAVKQVWQDVSDCNAIGLCIPGIVDHSSGAIAKAINLQCIIGLEPTTIVREAIQLDGIRIVRITDSFAAAYDVWNAGDGRIAAISIGTGVGLCVLDNGVPLNMGNATPGHLGQVDVSLGEDNPPVGPDGGRGGLEAYVGWPALQVRYGTSSDDLTNAFMSDDTPLRALARAMRIVHAIYLPQRIVLLGGVGTAMRPWLEHLRLLVSDKLTTLAREDWTLETGCSLHHAAAGAAKLAANTVNNAV